MATLKRLTVRSDGRTPREILQGVATIHPDAAVQSLFSRWETTIGRTYNLLIIAGEGFTDEERTGENIRARAQQEGAIEPRLEEAAEIAALFAAAYGLEDLPGDESVFAVVFHQPGQEPGTGRETRLVVDTQLHFICVSFEDEGFSANQDFIFVLP